MISKQIRIMISKTNRCWFPRESSISILWDRFQAPHSVIVGFQLLADSIAIDSSLDYLELSQHCLDAKKWYFDMRLRISNHTEIKAKWKQTSISKCSSKWEFKVNSVDVECISIDIWLISVYRLLRIVFGWIVEWKIVELIIQWIDWKWMNSAQQRTKKRTSYQLSCPLEHLQVYFKNISRKVR